MADFEIPENPVYTEAVRKFEEEDPAHADLFNVVVQALINNEAYLKRNLEKKASLESPTFTGTPNAPTPEANTNSAQIATTAFVKTAVNNLVNGAPETLDTLKELADAITENETVVVALNAAIGEKLSKTETAAAATKWSAARNINGMSIDGTANRNNYGICQTAAGTAAKTVSCTGFSLATGAEMTVKFTYTNTVSSPTLNVNGTGAKPIYYRGSAISASYLAANRTYTFRYNGTQWEFVGDINVNTDTNTWKANTASSEGYVASGSGQANKVWKTDANGNPAWREDLNTAYTHPTTSGNKHIPSGGSSGQILRWSADGTAAWGSDNNTTYSTATTSSSGLMSAADKTKLDGIASGAQVNTMTGVKGNAESSYRTGNVNLTPANIGAFPQSGGTVSGSLTVTGSTTLEGNVRIKPSGKNYGSIINIGDGDFIRISEDSDDVLNVKAKQINITSSNKNAVYINGNQAAALKHLTQAQYDALTTEQQTDGTIYFITEGT